MAIYLGNQKIGDSIYKNNSKLGKIIEGSLKEISEDDLYQTYFINDYKFAYSDGLEKITFHNEIYEIGEESFGYCANLEKVSNFCGSRIGHSAFYFCEKLKDVDIKNRVSIGDYVFRKCSISNEVVENIINSKAYEVGRYCFMECNNLTKLNLTFENFSDTINEIGPDYSLSGTEVPEGLFMSCTNLEEVIFGPKVVKINDQVFSNCPKLKKLTIMSEYPPKIHSSGFIDNIYDHSLETIYIPKGTIDLYKESYPFWANFSDIFVEME